MSGATLGRVTPSVLVVDDDAPIRRMLERTLAAEGYGVAAAADGGAALAAVERSAPDLRRARRRPCPGSTGSPCAGGCARSGLALPILLLTARDAVADRVAGLDAGADDYLVKPFAAEELLARVRALLRRGASLPSVLAFGDLVLDVEARAARRGGAELALSAREADLLELLLRNPRQVVTRELGARAGLGRARRREPERRRPLRLVPAPQARRAAADPDRARRRLRARPMIAALARRPLDPRRVARDPARARRRRRRRRRARRAGTSTARSTARCAARAVEVAQLSASAPALLDRARARSTRRSAAQQLERRGARPPRADRRPLALARRPRAAGQAARCAQAIARGRGRYASARARRRATCASTSRRSPTSGGAGGGRRRRRRRVDARRSHDTLASVHLFVARRGARRGRGVAALGARAADAPGALARSAGSTRAAAEIERTGDPRRRLPAARDAATRSGGSPRR